MRESYNIHCPLNASITDACQWEVIQMTEQFYFTTKHKGLKLCPIMRCRKHGSQSINLLRDKDKLKLFHGAAIVDMVRALTAPQHYRDNLFVIMVTNEQNPSPNRYIHFTTTFLRLFWSRLWIKPNMNLARNMFVHDYAQHAFSLYQETVSLSRLQKEADIILPKDDTLRRAIFHFFNQFAKEMKYLLREQILKYPYRQFSVDGNQKMVQRLRIMESRAKFDVNASLNLLVCGGSGLIGNVKVYPKSAETN